MPRYCKTVGKTGGVGLVRERRDERRKEARRWEVPFSPDFLTAQGREWSVVTQYSSPKSIQLAQGQQQQQ